MVQKGPNNEEESFRKLLSMECLFQGVKIFDI